MTQTWRQYFPSLQSGQTVYLDSASSCQMPEQAITAISDYLRNGHGNPHRGMYSFSETAEESYHNCRFKLAKFLNAEASQLIFTRGTTESINLVANSFREQISDKNTILVTQMEHHANLLPWQRVCEQTGAKLQLLPVKSNGELDLTNLENYLSDNCALFAFTHISNVLGTINPIEKLIAAANHFQVPVLIDGAQALAHSQIDLKNLNCDYYAFSGHKIYGPSGIGGLYCRDPGSLSPLLLGGGIVTRVTDDNYQLVDDIVRFEAGSPNMPGIVGLNASLDFINSLDLKSVHQHEKSLSDYMQQRIDPNLFKVISHALSTNILSLVSDKYHSHDVASILSEKGIAVRAGHHCAQPCLTALGVKHCVRISFGLYNDQEDIDRSLQALNSVPSFLD